MFVQLLTSLPSLHFQSQHFPMKKPKLDEVYYFENGFRKIRPYEYFYETFTKERWLNRTLFDVFSKEFRSKSPEYYKEAILNGNVTVNDKIPTLETVLTHSDCIKHKACRHEPPVFGEIKILFNDSKLLVIDKPASIPAHPTGRYTKNSVTEILKHEFGFEFLSCINRLDRLTSGIMLLALDKETAKSMGNKLKKCEVKKKYVCKVNGKFPDEIHCKEPIKVINHRNSTSAVQVGGKECETYFKRLKFDGEFSIVECSPITGRGHQIRVHLDYLGYPIVNDPVYNPRTPHYRALVPEGVPVDGKCAECENPIEDPQLESLYICLHSFNYKTEDWEFETEFPSWANIEEKKDI